MSLDIDNFILINSDKSPTERKDLATIVYGQVITTSLPIPTSPVDQPEIFYISNYLQIVNNHVSAINEKIVVDVDGLKSAIKAMWLTRYSLVYAPSTQESIDLFANVIIGNSVLAADAAATYSANMSRIKTLIYKYAESSDGKLSI